jgi:hypothetical protein
VRDLAQANERRHRLGGVKTVRFRATLARIDAGPTTMLLTFWGAKIR